LAKQLSGADVIQSMLVTMNLAMVVIGNLSATVLVSQVGVRRLVLFSLSILGEKG